VTSRATLLAERDHQAGRRTSVTPLAKLKLPREKVDASRQKRRLTKLQSVIKKATSRFDEDYQVERLQKLHQSFIDGPTYTAQVMMNKDEGGVDALHDPRSGSQTPNNA
jgi:hypothetical protein